MRRRGAGLEEAILKAAWEVLVEDGYASFTYEAVAARAQTSRPVLYRRWPQRSDLLEATFARAWMANRVDIPDTGKLRDDALGLLQNINLNRAHVVMLISPQLMDYFRESGTSFGELRQALYARGEATAFEKIVARAVSRGELPDQTRASRVVNLPFDLLRHEILMTKRAASTEALGEIVDQVWLPLLGMPHRPAASAKGRASR